MAPHRGVIDIAGRPSTGRQAHALTNATSGAAGGHSSDQHFERPRRLVNLHSFHALPEGGQFFFGDALAEDELQAGKEPHGVGTDGFGFGLRGAWRDDLAQVQCLVIFCGWRKGQDARGFPDPTIEDCHTSLGTNAW